MSKGSLSQAEVSRLLSQVASPEAAVARLSSHFSSQSLSPAERLAAEQVIRGMLQGAAVKVRQILAETLKESEFLPHDIAMQLANDVESVALPVLQFSSVLTDSDLLEVVQAGGTAKQVAVATRKTVSAEVADAIIHSDNGSAVAALVGNEGAELSDELVTEAADRFGMDSRVVDNLKGRANLPVTVAERLVAFTIESLRSFVASRTDLGETAVNQVVLRAREQATVDLRSPQFPAEEAVQLVQQLHRFKRLTPSLMLRALCVGDIGMFEASLSELAGVPLHNVRTLIHDSGQLGLQSLYERANLPPNYLPAFRVALDVTRATPLDGGEADLERYRRLILERILTQFEDIGAEDLDYLMIRLDDPNAVIANRQAPHA